MGTVQALTDQMVAASVNNQEPTSEDTLHKEAVDLPNPEMSQPLQKVDPDIYSESNTLGRQKAAEDATVPNPLMKVSGTNLYQGNPNIGRSTAGSWTKLYEAPNQKKDAVFTYNERFLTWLKINFEKEDLTRDDLEELAQIGKEQPKLVEAYPNLFEGVELEEEIETTSEEKAEDLEFSTTEQIAIRDRIKEEIIRIYN